MKLTIIHRSRGFYDVLQEDEGKIICTYNHPDNIFIFLAKLPGKISIEFKDETMPVKISRVG